MNDYDDFPHSSSKKMKFKAKFLSSRDRYDVAFEAHPKNRDFHCAHCHHFVSAHPLLSGVNNRNHCPYCLWSRHLDLDQAGDRLCACKGLMQPVGLTLKSSRKKYASRDAGELMLVHACTECGSVSINRIAADDDSQKLLEVFEDSRFLFAGLEVRLQEANIQMLQTGDSSLVYARIFGQVPTSIDV
jgi:hypothetical protein